MATGRPFQTRMGPNRISHIRSKTRSPVPVRSDGRLVGNAFLDTAVGAIPLAGDVFDVMFRANIKNMALLRRHLEKKGYARHTGPVIEGEAVRID